MTAKEALRQAEAEGLTLLRSVLSSTGYKGVGFNSSRPKPYEVQVQRGGKPVSLGSFATAEEAALCYARSPEAQAAVAAAAAPPPPQGADVLSKRRSTGTVPAHKSLRSASPVQSPLQQPTPQAAAPSPVADPPRYADAPRHRSTWVRKDGEYFHDNGIEQRPAADVQHVAEQDVPDLFPGDDALAARLRSSQTVCRVLAAASNGCMNHFLASRDDQVEVVKLLCESLDTEGAAESLALMIDAGCFVELQGSHEVPPVVVVLRNAAQYSAHKEIVDRLLRRCDMDKV